MKDDLISRQAAIDAVHKEFDGCFVWDESGEYTADEVERILDCVPSAEPERKTGRWIATTEDWKQQIVWWKCSECGMDVSTQYNYCPSCGAKMEGERDGSD